MVVIYDIETLKSCFTYTAINKDTEEIYKFVLHKDKFEIEKLIEHLEKCKGAIGFNNINFDYPIIHFIIEEYYKWGTYNFNSEHNKIDFITAIYSKAQEIIETQDSDTFYKTIAIPTKQWKIHQLDLFKLWHYNNKARSTSLKALEISMNYPNVMEMPIDHTRDDITIDEVPSILKYNLNDVLATFEFYKRSKDKISLRKDIEKQFNIPCINFSDSKIGEQLVLSMYCDYTNKKIWDVKELRTYRSKINLANCILDKIKFDSKPFNKLLEKLKNKTITSTKGAIEESVIYEGFKYDYGTGGIHGCIKSGIYNSDDQYIIIDADVSSLYPSLAITNGFYIQHLGKEFLDVYTKMLNMRIEAKNAGNMVLSDGFKLALNSVYGKSNDINSFLYDPEFTMKITLNGQLMLTMLAEKLHRIKDITILQINTDGITVKLPKNNRSINAYYNICKEWEEITKLNLEFVEYEKMWIADVNNYGALTTKGKIKNKGRFEVDKVVGSEPAYHKDNSFKIIPLALQEYYTKGIPIEETIKNHRNIYDFCGRQKFTRESYGQTHGLVNMKEVIERQQKNVRYYVSNKGFTFIKYYTKGTSEMINKGYQVMVYNNHIEKPFEDYNIDYSFYIREARKEIQNIETNQLELQMF